MSRRARRVRLRLGVLLVLTALLLLAVVFARQICPFDPYAHDYAAALLPPCPAHPLGTDQFGRDMLARVLVGGQTSIFSALGLVGVLTLTGTAAGLVCGWAGGLWDTLLMRLADLCLAFPGLVAALGIAALANGGSAGAVLALAVIGWPKYARLVRSHTLTLRDSDFVAAAKLAGESPAFVVVRHILPNLAGPVLVTAALDVGTSMMELAGLSFLGLGAQSPAAEWGSMMSGSRSMLQLYPWVLLAPGLAIFLTTALFNLLGDAVRDVLAPEQNTAG